MPLDPSIPLGVRPAPFNNPFASLIAMREGEQQRAAQQREQEQRDTQLRQSQQRIDIDQSDADEKRAARFSAQQVKDAAEKAYQSISGGNAEEVLSLLQPEARVLAESWLGDISAARQKRDAEGIELGKRTAKFIQANGYEPVTSQTALRVLADIHPGAKDALEHAADPVAFRKLIDHFATLGDKPEADFTLSEGQTRFGPDGQPLANVPKPPEEPKSIEAALLAARNNPMEMNRLLKLQREQAAAGRVPAEPKYKDITVQENGQWVTKSVPEASTRGQSYPVAPSAAEQMDSRKFSKARPVMKGIGELSERINTLKGVIATASGKAERAKASVNLNDDVAEYESLVSGFTPMVARALGHTGVLTQQDVDSVKRLFPTAEDSKTLRDRKIARMESIFSDLEAATKGEGAATATKPPTNETPEQRIKRLLGGG